MFFISRGLHSPTLVTSKLSCSAFFKAAFLCSTRVLKLTSLTWLKDPVPHYYYSVSHLVSSLQEPYSLLLSFILPTTRRRDSCQVHWAPHIWGGAEKWEIWKLFCDNCLFCPIKAWHGRPVVCGPEPLPTRGHVMCRKNKTWEEMPSVNCQPLFLQPWVFHYLT